MAKIEDLAATVQELAIPGAMAKDIIASVRERHPGASKKDVVRAAFFALTGGVDGDPEKGRQIQNLALASRTLDEADAASTAPADAKRKRKGEARPA